MPSKLKFPAVRAPRVRTRHDDQQVHFHTGRDGRPFVCDVHACESPSLKLGEVQTAAAAIR